MKDTLAVVKVDWESSRNARSRRRGMSGRRPRRGGVSTKH